MYIYIYGIIGLCPRHEKYIKFDRAIFSPAMWQLNGYFGGEQNNDDIMQVGRFE